MAAADAGLNAAALTAVVLFARGLGGKAVLGHVRLRQLLPFLCLLLSRVVRRGFGSLLGVCLGVLPRVAWVHGWHGLLIPAFFRAACSRAPQE